MGEVRLTPRAEQDLRDIWHGIAIDSEKAADALLMRFLNRLELTAEHPFSGVARPELSSSARILIEGSYVIIYEPAPFGVLAVAIVHGMRDPEHWLTD